MKNFINKYTISIILLAFTTLLITEYYQSSQVSQQTTAFSGKITPLSYTNSTLLNTFNKKNIDEYQTAAGTYDIQTIASEITATMLAAFSNSSERTLPLVANWNVGIPEYSDGLDPLYMINRFTYGEHLVPTWKLDPYYNDNIGLSYYEASIKKAAELGLPLVFILPSPESALTKDDVYFSMDKTQNPNVITVNGTVLPKLSPFAPDSLWNEVGEQWSTTSLIAQLQEWYPNPPLVVFIDEDASKKLSWSKLAISSRYIEHYPTNTSNEFKRTLVNAKWLEKYRQLHEGFKQGFTKKGWKQNVKFLTRNQLASNMGVTADWINSSTTTNQHANIWPLTADGLTINFNLDADKTDTTDAPYRLLNNLPFMLEEAKELNPNFTYQLSIDANQKIDNPQRYRGFTQFALWFLRPSIIRQTPNKTIKDEINPLFQEVVDSVELIHNSDVLADFWKNGKLVSTGSSNYTQNIPTNYQSIPREFLLKTDASGPVWAFALEKGKAPNRDWLVYVQSSEENLSGVSVTIPDFQNISLNAKQEGAFFIVTESLEHQNTLSVTQLVATSIGHNISALDINYSFYDNPFIDIKVLYESKNINSPILGKGTIYYVDANNGDDTRNGLSEQTAWKSLNKVVSHSYNPGDSILFKRGNTFIGQLTHWSQFRGVKGNPITLGAYGTGKQPIISGLKKQFLKWKIYSANIWQTNLSYNPQRLLMDGKEILRADNVSSIDGKEYKWFYKEGILYVYNDSDNISNSDIVFSTYSVILKLRDSRPYINVQDINFQGGYSATIYIYKGQNYNIKNCTIGAYGHKAILIGGNDSISSHMIEINNNIIDSKFKFKYENSINSLKGNQEGIAIYGGNSNIIIKYNLLKNWGHTSILIYASNINEKYSNNNIKIHNNYITAPDISYGGRVDFDGYTHDVELYKNIIKDIYAPCQLNGHGNYIHNNIFDKMHNSSLKKAGNGSGKAIVMKAYSGPIYNNKIEYNTFLNTDVEAIKIDGNNIAGDIHNNIIKNNYFYNCNKKENIYFRIDKPFIIPGKQEGTVYDNIVEDNLFWNDEGGDIKLQYYGKKIDIVDLKNKNLPDNKIINNIVEKSEIDKNFSL